ncbi:MAG: DUF971 domain-containing protein [Bryobacteraceae bacterium]|jgi:DUF971 family protein
MSLSTDPEHIAISKSKGIQIDWKDGHHSDYGLTWLRDKCPCAACTGAHGTEPRKAETGASSTPFPMFKPALKMLAVEGVGNYAIRIDWSDGHNSGIYSYEHFRSICPCQQCNGATK